MNLQEIRARLISSLAVCLDIYHQHKFLNSTRECWEEIQLASAWLKEASEQLQKEMNGIVTGDVEPVGLISPTLISTDERLSFVKNQLSTLSDEAWSASEHGMNPAIQYKILQAYNKINDAKFLNELSINYYEQYKRFRDERARASSRRGPDSFLGGGDGSGTDSEGDNQGL